MEAIVVAGASSVVAHIARLVKPCLRVSLKALTLCAHLGDTVARSTLFRAFCPAPSRCSWWSCDRGSKNTIIGVV